MAKNKGRKALYEAIGESRGKLIDGYSPCKISRKDRKTDGENSYSFKINISDKLSQALSVKWDLQKLVGFSTVVLVIIFVCVISIKKLYKNDGNSNPGALETPVAVEQTANKNTPEPVFDKKIKTLILDKGEKSDQQTPNSAEISDSSAVLASNPDADNVIVVTRYVIEQDLKPVADFFKSHGIDLEIIKMDKNYLLVSRKRYTGGFSRVGSEAYADLKKIKRIGANYKAPEEFEPFGSKPFQDAYGMKISW